MIAVIFEVQVAEGRQGEYLDIAAALKPKLSQISGFISVERFQSLTDPKKILSLSYFETEEAIAEWRNIDAHRIAQRKGRSGVFEGYQLRIAAVFRDYGMFDRVDALPKKTRMNNVQSFLSPEFFTFLCRARGLLVARNGLQC